MQASLQKGPLLAGVPTPATANTAAQTAVKVAAQNPTRGAQGLAACSPVVLKFCGEIAKRLTPVQCPTVLRLDGNFRDSKHRVAVDHRPDILQGRIRAQTKVVTSLLGGR